MTIFVQLAAYQPGDSQADLADELLAREHETAAVERVHVDRRPRAALLQAVGGQGDDQPLAGALEELLGVVGARIEEQRDLVVDLRHEHGTIC